MEIAFRIYLCTGERSFSKLRRIKDESRTNMKQHRLTMLSIMAIESDILRELSFNDIIFDFASMKTRKDFI